MAVKDISETKNEPIDYRQSSLMIYFGYLLRQLEINLADGAREKFLLDFKKLISLFINIYKLFQEDYDKITKIECLGEEFFIKKFSAGNYSGCNGTKTLVLTGDISNQLFINFDEVTLESSSRGKKYRAYGRMRGDALQHIDDKRYLAFDEEVIKGYIELFSKYEVLYKFLEKLYKNNFVVWEMGTERIMFQLSYANFDSKKGVRIDNIDGVRVIIESDNEKANYHMEIFIDSTTGEIDYSKCSLQIGNSIIVVADDIYSIVLDAVKIRRSNLKSSEFNTDGLERYYDALFNDKNEQITNERRLNMASDFLMRFENEILKMSSDAPRLTLKDYVKYFYEAYNVFISGLSSLEQIDNANIRFDQGVKYHITQKGRKLEICTLNEHRYDRVYKDGKWVDGDGYFTKEKVVIEQIGNTVSARCVTTTQKEKYYNRHGESGHELCPEETNSYPITAYSNVLIKYLDFFQAYYSWIEVMNSIGKTLPPINVGKMYLTLKPEFIGDSIEKLAGFSICISDSVESPEHSIYVYFNLINGITIDYEKSSISFVEEKGNGAIKEVIDTLLERILVPMASNGYVNEDVIRRYVKCSD